MFGGFGLIVKSTLSNFECTILRSWFSGDSGLAVL